MTSPPIGVERRMGQRFTFNLPVALREVAGAAAGLGITHDLSSRGAFLFTHVALCQGAEVELTLKMPSEITLGESMNVRCRGRVLRVVAPAESAEKNSEREIGIAVCFQGYEHLAEAEDESAGFQRIAALHGDNQPDRAQSASLLSSRAFEN